VPLVNGVGFWAWNMNVQPGQSKFAMMLSKIGNLLPGTSTKSAGSGTSTGSAGANGGIGPAPARRAPAAGALAPGNDNLRPGQTDSGLRRYWPAIYRRNCLHVVDAIYGFMQSQGGGKPDTVFEFQDQMMYATQDARQKYADPGVHLLPGEYVIVPSTSVRDLLGQKYKLLDSALVPSDTTDAQKDEALPARCRTQRMRRSGSR